MSTFGKHLTVSLFGASHEDYIGITIHNYPAGVLLNNDLINKRLKLRMAMANITSKRHERDDYEIISGVFNKYTTGAPITILIKNKDVRSKDYDKIYGVARPSHADYAYFSKYNGYNDYRGGGTSSGRLTAVLIVLGALCEQLLVDNNIIVASRIKQIYSLIDKSSLCKVEDLTILKEEEFPVLDKEIKALMYELIKKTKLEEDSLGAIVETYISGVPLGLGDPFFDSFESILSHLIFSIPGVKGIEFGIGFDFVNLYGSEANDQMTYINKEVKFLSNNNGGINGGITNGDVINFKTVFKPTSSIGKKQQSINFIKKENQELEVKGRHDTIIALKGVQVVNAITNYALVELIMGNNLWKK